MKNYFSNQMLYHIYKSFDFNKKMKLKIKNMTHDKANLYLLHRFSLSKFYVTGCEQLEKRHFGHVITVINCFSRITIIFRTYTSIFIEQ